MWKGATDIYWGEARDAAKYPLVAGFSFLATNKLLNHDMDTYY